MRVVAASLLALMMIACADEGHQSGAVPHKNWTLIRSFLDVPVTAGYGVAIRRAAEDFPPDDLRYIVQILDREGDPIYEWRDHYNGSFLVSGHVLYRIDGGSAGPSSRWQVLAIDLRSPDKELWRISFPQLSPPASGSYFSTAPSCLRLRSSGLVLQVWRGKMLQWRIRLADGRIQPTTHRAE